MGLVVGHTLVHRGAVIGFLLDEVALELQKDVFTAHITAVQRAPVGLLVQEMLDGVRKGASVGVLNHSQETVGVVLILFIVGHLKLQCLAGNILLAGVRIVNG